MAPDEVRNMSNKKCLIFIKGFNPIFDDNTFRLDIRIFHRQKMVVEKLMYMIQV